ncbi:MAG: YfiR family protein [Candidatus Kapaibacterium sp.]|nr:MAG: YfiR family protein [Candidatus Kapabacteria bacterium]
MSNSIATHLSEQGSNRKTNTTEFLFLRLVIPHFHCIFFAVFTIFLKSNEAFSERLLGESVGANMASEQHVLHNLLLPKKPLFRHREHKVERMKRRVVCLVLILILSLGNISLSGQQGLFESLYILKMTGMVRYPAERTSGEYIIGVVGSPDIAAQIDRSLTGKKVGDQTIKVRLFDEITGLANCHIIFLPDQYSKKLARILDAVRGKPVLIITKGVGMAREGSHISILASGDKKFEINKKAAESVGIRIQDDLLRLATVVEGGQ